MWKILAVAVALFCFIGCSNDNQIKIENRALQTIYFNFRAQEYIVLGYNDVTPDKPSGVAGECIIKDIPNGNYNYGVTYQLPGDAKTWGISGLAQTGGLSFQKTGTHYLMQYNYTEVNFDYQINVVLSSSDPASIITSP
jgi:hypothetical protein